MATDTLTQSFRALADPTRRAILSRLAQGETTVAELSKPFRMTPSAITKHLKILQRAGLISQTRQAQWRPCKLEAAPLQEVATWVNQYQQYWTESFDRLDQYLASIKENQ